MTSTIKLILVLITIAFGDQALAASCTVPGTHTNLVSAVDDTGCDSITVADGVWEASVLISRDLSIQGSNFGEPVLMGKANQTVIEIVSPVSLHLQGIQLTSTGSDPKPAIVIKAGGMLTMSDVSSTLSDLTFSVGGSVGGLVGSGLVLQNNTDDMLDVSADGIFTFANILDDGSAYAVTVFSQPGDPTQTCEVFNGSGTITGTNVTNIDVVCVTTLESIFINGFEE